MTKFNPDRKNGLWSDVYKKGFKTIIEVLKENYKNPSGYIVMLLYIYERSKKLKAIVDKYDDKLLEKLEVEYTKSQNMEKVVNRDTKKIIRQTTFNNIMTCLLLKMTTHNTQARNTSSPC
jgi:hypothetical protein